MKKKTASRQAPQQEEQREKICRTCGRPFAWRAAWAKDWAQVLACSAACKRGPSSLSRLLEADLLQLVRSRGHAKTACPSDAVRARYGDKALWPADAMRHARWAVNRLAHGGELEVVQGGRPVDAPSAKGAIRVRLPRNKSP